MDSTTLRPLMHAGKATWRKWAVGVLVLAVVGGWLWWSVPQPLRIVATYPAVGEMLQPTTAGFLYMPDHFDHVALRRWDGRLQWSQEYRFVEWGFPSSILHAPPFELAISPDGRSHAMIYTKQWIANVKVWRNDRLTGVVAYTLPSDSKLYAVNTSLNLLNCSLALVTISTEQRLGHEIHLFLQKDSRIVATGVIHEPFDYISPDMTMICRYDQKTGLHVTPLHVRERKICTGKAIIIPPASELNLDNYGLTILLPVYPSLCAGGAVIDKQGTVYRTDGTITKMLGGWRLLDTISPNGRYVLLRQGDHLRAFCPATGDRWTFRSVNGNEGDVTDDGRFVMETRQLRLPGLLREIVALSRLGETVLKTAVIIERPGHVRAVLRIPSDASSWWISPDGHTVAMMRNGKVALYRW